MSEFDPARHAHRLADAATLANELLPDPELEVSWARQEFEDGVRCGDSEHLARVDAEVAKRQETYGRLVGLWMIAARAAHDRSEELSESAAAEMKRTVRDEFRRREEGTR